MFEHVGTHESCIMKLYVGICYKIIDWNILRIIQHMAADIGGLKFYIPTGICATEVAPAIPAAFSDLTRMFK